MMLTDNEIGAVRARVEFALTEQAKEVRYVAETVEYMKVPELLATIRELQAKLAAPEEGGG